LQSRHRTAGKRLNSLVRSRKKVGQTLNRDCTDIEAEQRPNRDLIETDQRLNRDYEETELRLNRG
jgi:hypothetical protein